MRITLQRLAAISTILAVSATTACADPKPKRGSVFDDVEHGVTYQMAGSALALATRCARAPEWQDYDRERLLADYKASRDYLEQFDPGRRIYAEFETLRLLKEYNDTGVNAGDAGQTRFCAAMTAALLTKYRQ